jgi:protein TonB
MTATAPRWEGWLAGGILALVVVGGLGVLLTPPRPPAVVAAPPISARALTLAPVPPPPAVERAAAMGPAAVAAAPAPTMAALPPLDLPDLPGPTVAALVGPPTSGLPPVTLPGLSVPAVISAPVAPLGPTDEPPTLLGGFDLERFYPREARLRGIGGESRVELELDAEGMISRIVLRDSTPPGVFDVAARRLAQSLRYRPARRDGQAVATLTTVVIRWNLR